MRLQAAGVGDRQAGLAFFLLGEHVWVDNRDQRFTAGLDAPVAGLEHTRKAGRAITTGTILTDPDA